MTCTADNGDVYIPQKEQHSKDQSILGYNCLWPLQYQLLVQCCYGNGSTNCYIHARNACTPLPYCCSSLSASLVCVVGCVVSVWKIQSASVVQCFTMLHQCFTMLHQCFTMLHQCIYGRKPSMNQPIVGELTLVMVLVCSCVHGRSASF